MKISNIMSNVDKLNASQNQVRVFVSEHSSKLHKVYEYYCVADNSRLRATRCVFDELRQLIGNQYECPRCKHEITIYGNHDAIEIVT